MPEERVVLEDEADAPIAGVAIGRVVVFEEHRPGVGRSRPAMMRKQRGLAGAGRPEQRHQLAGCHREAHVVDAT